MAAFDTTSYWNERLAHNPGLCGVGFTSLGLSYNTWQYWVRKTIFRRATSSIAMDYRQARVLDVGSGTGFYLDRWKELGVGQLRGSDFSEVAVRRLQRKYPEIEFSQLDIGDHLPENLRASQEAVSAFDMLFHIVDDARYRRAIQNIHAALAEGGWFLFSDFFVHEETKRWEHMVARSLNEVERTLTSAGFRIVSRKPVFVLMNQPLDCRNRAYAFLWKVLSRVIQTSDFVGYSAGVCLSALDLYLTGVMHESPTTEIMICQKA
jgi:SAM-dependent methyltransferase